VPAGFTAFDVNGDIKTSAVVNLSTGVTGVLPIANGGTNASAPGSAQANINSQISITTTGNIDDLDFGNASLIRMNNSGLSTIRGLLAGTNGQRVTIISVGGGQVDLAHENTGSLASNRLHNFATSANTSLAAGCGVATYQYDGTALQARWKLIEHFQGDFIDVAYSAGNFTAGGSMTWTVDAGDQITYAYYLSGRILTVVTYLDTTSIGGTPALQLFIAIPVGFTASRKFQNVSTLFDNGVFALAYVRVSVSGTTIEIGRGDTTNLTASTNNTYIRVLIAFSVN